MNDAASPSFGGTLLESIAEAFSELACPGTEPLPSTAAAANATTAANVNTDDQLPVAPPLPLPRPTIEDEMEAARLLDFDLLVDGKRPPRSGLDGKPIELSNVKRASPSMRSSIIWLR